MGVEKVIALLPWDITVRRARARKQAYEMLDRKDADEGIRGLTALEAYYAVKELGIESALPILAVVEPHQITAMLDLDVWQEHRASLSDILLWLTAFKEANPSQLFRAARATDPELLALLFARRLFIASRLPEDEATPADTPDWLVNPSEALQPLIETPDRRFIIAARVVDPAEDPPARIDEEERKAILDLVDTLYKDEDWVFVVGVLRLAETDVPSTIEEDAYRFRNGRLEDLGFPSLERATEVYAPLDPREMVGGDPIRGPVVPDLLLPALHAQQFDHGLFQEALRAIESPDVVRRIEGELLPLANSVLVADRVEPGDLQRMRDVLGRMRAYLELALAHETPRERRVEIARARLEEHPVRHLFRVGFGITLELKRRADRLRRSGAFAAVPPQDAAPAPVLGPTADASLALLSETERAVLDALRGARPMISSVLDEPPGAADEVRPFRSSEDVAKVRHVLDGLEAIAPAITALRLAEANAALGGAIDPPLPGERDLDVLLATAAARAVLGERFRVTPLGGDDLRRLCALLAPASGGARTRAFPAAVIERARSAARAEARQPAPIPALEQRIRRGLDALAESLSPLVGASEIDPRYVGVVVRRID